MTKAIPVSGTKRERGFTLIETTLATAIGAMIMGALVVSIYYFNDLTTRYQDSLTVSHQLQSASSLLNHDVVCAYAGTVSGQSLRLEIPGYAFGDTATVPTTNTITYTCSIDGDLIREKDDGFSTVVARHVDTGTLSFAPVGPITATSQVTITVATTVRDQDESTTLVFCRRPSN